MKQRIQRVNINCKKDTKLSFLTSVPQPKETRLNLRESPKFILFTEAQVIFLQHKSDLGKPLFESFVDFTLPK